MLKESFVMASTSPTAIPNHKLNREKKRCSSLVPADSLIPQLHPSTPSRRPHLRKQFKVIEEIGYNRGMRDSTRSQRCKKVPPNESQNEGTLVQADPLALTADIPIERKVHGLRKPIPTQSGV